jgi:hypothetical protein
LTSATPTTLSICAVGAGELAAVDADDAIGAIANAKIRKRMGRQLAKARGKSMAEDLFPKLATGWGSSAIFKAEPPPIFHAEGQRPGDGQPGC